MAMCELSGNRGAGFVHRPRARGRQPDSFQIFVGRRVFDPVRERRISDSVFLMSHAICLTSLCSSRVNFLLSKNTGFSGNPGEQDRRHPCNKSRQLMRKTP